VGGGIMDSKRDMFVVESSSCGLGFLCGSMVPDIRYFSQINVKLDLWWLHG